MQEMRVPSLVWEDPLEDMYGNPLQDSCLKNPMDREEFGGLQSIGSQRVGHAWSDLACMHTHTSKVMLKILQAILQQYVNQEIPDVQV